MALYVFDYGDFKGVAVIKLAFKEPLRDYGHRMRPALKLWPLAILFLAVTAEEQGLLGSQFYAVTPIHPLARTAANINIDGIGGIGKTTLADTLVREALTQGRFGRIYMVNVNVFWTRPQSYYDEAPWRGRWDMDGGAFMNQASHYVDMVDWLVGPVDNVHAYTATLARDIDEP